MTITEFLKDRQVERQAVSKYIIRHPEIFEGHATRGKTGKKETELDDVAVQELEKVYPIPKPVVVIQGVPQEEHIRIQQELIATQKQVTELQQRLLNVQERLAAAEVQRMTLEQKEEHIQKLEEELEQERSKTWLQKLFGRNQK